MTWAPRLNFIANCTAFLTMLRQAGPIRFWAMCGAAIVLTAYCAWLTYIVAYDPWPVAQAARRLDIIGKSMWIALGSIVVIVVSLSSQRLSARGFGGTSIDISGAPSDPPTEPPQVVTTTTTTEVK